MIEVELNTNFFGFLNRDEAEDRLAQNFNGEYILRFSRNLGSYVLSMRFGSSVKHLPLRPSGSGYRSTDEQLLFPTVQDMIRYYQEHAAICSKSEVLTPVSAAPSTSRYVNLEELYQYSWFMGRMERDTAEYKLQSLPDGTFLVRLSQSQPKYAVSVCYQDEVKHLMIESCNETFFFDEIQIFSSVVELIAFYQTSSLSKMFSGIDTNLKFPLESLIKGSAVVLHDWQGNNSKMLDIFAGEKIMILSKNGSENGWWKGKIGRRVGYFPMAYVCEIQICDSMDKNASDL